jgi:hypothetical protein
MARGWPGRLTISVWPRMPAVCRERMAVGTFSSEHQLAEARHQFGADCFGRLRRNVAQRRSCAAGRHHQRAALIAKLLQGLFDGRPVIGNNPHDGDPRRGQEAVEVRVDGRSAPVLVLAAAGAVGDRDYTDFCRVLCFCHDRGPRRAIASLTKTGPKPVARAVPSGVPFRGRNRHGFGPLAGPVRLFPALFGVQ